MLLRVGTLFLLGRHLHVCCLGHDLNMAESTIGIPVSADVLDCLEGVVDALGVVPLHHRIGAPLYLRFLREHPNRLHRAAVGALSLAYVIVRLFVTVDADGEAIEVR